MIRRSGKSRDRRRKARFEFLEHDADIGLRVSAESLEELFAAAAEGMTAVMTEPSRVRARGRMRVAVSAESREEALVNWLREWLYLYEAGRFVGRRFKLERAGAEGAAGFGFGEKRGARHPALREVKGVTWHQVSVKRAGKGWLARVIFDV